MKQLAQDGRQHDSVTIDESTTDQTVDAAATTTAAARTVYGIHDSAVRTHGKAATGTRYGPRHRGKTTSDVHHHLTSQLVAGPDDQHLLRISPSSSHVHPHQHPARHQRGVSAAAASSDAPHDIHYHADGSVCERCIRYQLVSRHSPRVQQLSRVLPMSRVTMHVTQATDGAVVPLEQAAESPVATVTAPATPTPRQPDRSISDAWAAAALHAVPVRPASVRPPSARVRIIVPVPTIASEVVQHGSHAGPDASLAITVSEASTGGYFETSEPVILPSPRNHDQPEYIPAPDSILDQLPLV